MLTLTSAAHEVLKQRLRYAHPTQAHQAKAMEQLEQFNAAQQIAAFEKQQLMMAQRCTELSASYREDWRRGPGSNRRIKVLQTSPLPLGYRAT